MRTAVVTTSYPAWAGDPSGHFVETEARRIPGRVVVIAPGVTAAGAPAEVEAREQRAACPDGEVVVVRVAGGEAFGWPGFTARLRRRPLCAFAAARWMGGAVRALGANGPFDRVVAHWALPSAWPVASSALSMDRRAGARASAGPDGAAIAALDGASLEVVSHGADVRLLLGLPSFVRERIVRRIVRRAARWRFVSSTLLELLLAGLGAASGRALSGVASVAPCAIDMPDVAAAVASRRAQHAGVYLYVCAGRLVPAKRVDRVIVHVAAAAGDPRPERRTARLVLVGDGPERARLERLARARGVDARFVGLAPREEALAWIGAANALLHASREEGLSTVIREAEALGTRVEHVA